MREHRLTLHPPIKPARVRWHVTTFAFEDHNWNARIQNLKLPPPTGDLLDRFVPLTTPADLFFSDGWLPWALCFTLFLMCLALCPTDLLLSLNLALDLALISGLTAFFCPSFGFFKFLEKEMIFPAENIWGRLLS